MSFWAATVITNLLSAIPVFGKKAAFWVWGGQGVAKATLGRFYTIHFFVPFVILGISFIHISLLHTEGSSEPLSVWDINDFLRFYPYFYLKDCFCLFLTCFLFCIFVFFYPNLLMHPDNYIPANALVTPAHIVPEWYFLPFYATLRAVPSKLGGVFIMGSFIGALAILPLLDPVNALRCPEYCPVYRLMFWFWVSGFLLLGYLGSMPVSYPFVFLSRFFVSYHFFFIDLYASS
jgi:ubiquinol-cytochrome c reductase cytochrome b subunit